jgi:hypothetical protein
VKAPGQTPSYPISNVIEAASSNLIYGLDQETTGSSLQTMSVDSNGVVLTNSVGGFFDIGNVELSYADGRIYTTAGYVIDPVNSTVVGYLEGCGTSVLADSGLGKVFCGRYGGIDVYSISDLSLIGVIDRHQSYVSSLTRWGASGLAYGSGTGALTIMDLDADGDGISAEIDNCQAWPNASQEVPSWPVPTGDDDCDGSTSADEYFIGTEAAQHCAATSAPNDEPLPDAWPVDFNDDQRANISDVTRFSSKFNSMAPGPPYDVRFDFNSDGRINISDVTRFSQFFNKSCAQ